MVKREVFLRRLFLFFGFAFLYFPIIVLMVYSFNNTKLMSTWAGFTFKWYRELFSNEEILNALKVTMTIAFITTLISTIVGTLAAVGLFSMKKNIRNVVLNFNYLPVLNPDIVTAISLMVLYRSFNEIIRVVFGVELKFGFFTMLFSHIAFTIPYVVLSVLPKLRQMNVHIQEAALDLGATPFVALRKVILPELKSGIFTGALFCFTLSLDDFVISFFTTGHGYQNLSTMIFSMAKKGINPSINALSTIMFLILVVLLFAISKRKEKE